MAVNLFSKMDSSNVKEIITCGICLEKFNEDSRCPRMLTCGHSFCQSCIEKLIKQRPCCPTCNKSFQFKKIESIPINFSLKSLLNIKTEVISSTISSTNPDNVQVGSDSETISAKRLKTKDKSFLSEGHCDEHNIYVGMRCMDCEVWLCAMCVVQRHKNCRTLLVEEAYTELKNRLSQRAETKQREMKETLLRLDEEIKKKESLKAEGRKFCQKLEELHGLVKSTAIGSGLWNAIIELEKLLPSVPLSKKQLENWCSSGSVYAEEDRFDWTKYGKVTVKEGRILVHNFQLEKPEGRIIPFKGLLSKFDPSTELPSTSFLRLTPTAGDAKGFDILIKTDGTSPRAKNFILLCSALKGPTYKGQVMVAKHPDIAPRINCFHLLSSLAPVTVGIINNDTRASVKKGGVYGTRKDDSWFFISWSDCPSRSECVVGSVVAGLHELSEQKGSTISISDCGLVI